MKGSKGAVALSKQLDRLEEKMEEMSSLIGSVAWYFEEAMDYLAILDEEITRIQEHLGIESSRHGQPPGRIARPPPPEG
jgi:hypothetical protein